jgi:hypothetical protein
MRHSTNVWSKDAELDSEGNVIAGKLWAKIEYNDITRKLYETRDGRRWRNGYGYEFTYRDRENVPIGLYHTRVAYYTSKGYTIISTDS